ncbi:hypothetical protein SAMN02745671_01561 [Anaerovibrio lipolyticus DSM 3074]|uniref:Uncharacterized protein n=2 Tax=Anaerovibrio lipolyticus TaxID=82374 RepID=A0A0B2JX14_9FIRM|nr:hypothetical protein [Anaerovibrio lipolyticus]KHM52855.1 hypothetical protein NZ47_02315 [Anaerovibrio lipolyticus]SHI75388.1 hypothetical protein SAMN02745671_01561 [Anaerovibrio lipolyticus DSM 3074]
MPTNVTGMTPSVQPAERTQETKGDKLSVKRDGGGSSGSAFSPRTDVNIKNSIDNMAGVLSKISTHHSEAENAIPSELKNIIQNIMRNAFTLEGTVGEGVGSSLASQRFSVEQLNTLSRIMTQLGQMADQGKLGDFSEGLQTVFDNLKAVLGNNSSMETVNINKLAFQLMQLPEGEEMPRQLEQLLAQLAAVTNPQPAQGAQQPTEGLNILNKLVDAFFPKSAFTGDTSQSQPQQGNAQGTATGNSAQMAPQGVQTALQGGQAAQSGATANLANNMAGNAGVSGTENMPQGAAQQVNAGGQGAQQTQTGGNGPQMANQTQTGGNGPQMANQTQTGGNGPQMANQTQPGGNSPQMASQIQQGTTGTTVNTAGNPANATSVMAENTAMPQGMAQTQGNQSTQQNTAMPNQSTMAAEEANQSQTNFTIPGRETINVRLNNIGMAYEGTSARMNGPVEQNPLFRSIFNRFGPQHPIENNNAPAANTTQYQLPQMDSQQVALALKDAGQLIMKNMELTPKETQLLNNFINENQGMLSEQDAKQLNTLLRTIEGNMPASVQQAAQKMGFDALPKLWAFMQLADISTLKKMKGYQYRSASKEIVNFTNAIKGSMDSDGAFKADGQKSISYMMPLYVGDGTLSYPAYLHIYDEPPHEDEYGVTRKDTWFRVCVLTDEIGAVDVVCRLYDGNNLNLRVVFSDNEAVDEFKEYLPDIRKALYNTPINLTDLKIGTVSNDE